MMGLTFHSPAQTPSKAKQASLKGNKMFSFQFHYTYEQPGGDMATRFGQIHNVGSGVMFKTRNHWMAAFDLSYEFGYVKSLDFLYNLTNSAGYISNTNGQPANYSVSMRGSSLFLKFGRIFPLSAYNRNSGIIIMAGGGFYASKINIYTARNDIAPLTPELKKGYDRLSSGAALTQFIGYIFYSENRFYNFYAGFDFVQAFTVNRRGYNYDTMQADTKQKLDMLTGIRVGWIIPIYLTSGKEEEFNYR